MNSAPPPLQYLNICTVLIHGRRTFLFLARRGRNVPGGSNWKRSSNTTATCNTTAQHNGATTCKFVPSFATVAVVSFFFFFYFCTQTKRRTMKMGLFETSRLVALAVPLVVLVAVVIQYCVLRRGAGTSSAG